MRSRVVIGVLVVIVAAIALLWINRDAGTADPPAGETATPDRAESTSPRRVEPAPKRVRIEPQGAAQPNDAAPPPDAATDSTDSAEPAAPTPPVAELLEKVIPEFSIEGGVTLRGTFGRLSGATGAPIHVDLESVEALDEHDGLALQMVGVPGKDLLGVMSMMSGFQFTVLEDKVVLHAQDIELTQDRRTVVIEPVLPDPDVPISITVTGRVVDADGNAFAGAKLMLGAVEAGVADASGSFRVDVRPKNQQLTARATFRQRSAPFHVTGAYGDALDTELVMGPLAGGVRVRLLNAGEELPADLRVSVSWPDRSAPARITFDERRQRGFTEHVPIDGEGIAAFDGAAPGRVAVRVKAPGFRVENRMIDVEPEVRTEIAVDLVRESLAERLRAQRISFTFTDTSVDSVVAYIARSKSFNLVILPSAREGAFAEQVTLSATDDTVEGALDALCSAIGDVTWRIQDGLVVIEKRER